MVPLRREGRPTEGISPRGRAGLVVVAEVALDLVRVDAHLAGLADPYAEGFVEGGEVHLESNRRRMEEHTRAIDQSISLEGDNTREGFYPS